MDQKNPEFEVNGVLTFLEYAKPSKFKRLVKIVDFKPSTFD